MFALYGQHCVFTYDNNSVSVDNGFFLFNNYFPPPPVIGDYFLRNMTYLFVADLTVTANAET